MDEIYETDPADDAAAPATEGIISIAARLAATFTYASHQNSIPVMRPIRVGNSTADSVQNARLELAASPAFLRAKTWVIDRILAS